MDTTFLEVLHAAGDQLVYIRDPTDKTLQTIFDTWWTEKKATTKKPITWNGRKSASAWRFYKQCATVEEGRPFIVCIVCHQLIVHPAETGTSAMAKHLLRKEHVNKLNELTEMERDELSSTAVDEQALDVLKKKGSLGVVVASSF